MADYLDGHQEVDASEDMFWKSCVVVEPTTGTLPYSRMPPGDHSILQAVSHRS